MAIEVIWSDIHHRFATDAQGAIKVAINIDAVNSSINNILRTHKGERVMLPTFGAGLGDLLFEGMNEDTFDLYATQIQEAIEAWDDRVSVNSIDVTMITENNTMTLKMSFTVRGYDDVFEYSTNLAGV